MIILQTVLFKSAKPVIWARAKRHALPYHTVSVLPSKGSSVCGNFIYGPFLFLLLQMYDMCNSFCIISGGRWRV